MSRGAGQALLALSVAIFFVCAGLIAWRLLPRHAPRPDTPTVTASPTPAARTATPTPTPTRVSTMIDLPGDPVLVQRGVVIAPRELPRIAVPAKVAAAAPRIEGVGYFVRSQLVSTDGGYMGKFPESGQEADAVAMQLAYNAEALASGPDATKADVGSDDDGGDATPEDAQAQMLTDANSNQLEVAVNPRPELKLAVLRAPIAEKLSELLISNGYGEDSVQAIVATAKSVFNVQTLPAHGVALTAGALDATGVYRITQLAIYEDGEYVGSIALAENGAYVESARPNIPAGLFDDSSRIGSTAVRFTLADGVYSAGLRNGMAEPVIREAIQLLSSLTDLKGQLSADESLRVLYTRDYRGKSKTSGKVVYVGLSGSAGNVDCYAFEGADGNFHCFDPKGGASVPLPPTLGGGGGGKTGGVTSLGDSGAVSVNGILAPIKGAPVTSLFGTRFHPILHILRLHAGIDFGAPVGSQVRASADGKIEIAGPVSGFGNHIRIQHKGFETSYSHLSEIPSSIHPGVDVKQGEIIALSGNTGLSTGPHLHYQFYLNGTASDPLPHLGSEVQASAPTGGTGSSGGSGSSGPSTSSSGGSSGGASEAEVAAFATIKSHVDSILEAAAK